MRKLTYYILFLILFSGSMFGQWEQMYGPRGTAKIMYMDDDVAYVLTDSARIAKKAAADDIWSYTYTGIPDGVIIEGIEAEEAVIVAAGQSGGAEKGVFRSRDGGNSWIEVPGLPDINFYRINVVSDVWFAGGIDFSGPPLFYSTNQGANFDACVGLDAASQTGAMTEFNGKIFVSTSDGVYISTDSGVNFTKATGNGLPQFETLDYMFESSGTLRAFYFSFSESKLLESTDEGENWTEVQMSGIEENWVLKGASHFNGEFYAIAATDASLDLPRIYHSTDDGNNWSQIGSDLPFPILENEEAIAANSSEILVATYSGLFSTTDNGTTWEDASEGLRYNGSILAQAFVQGNWVISTNTGLYKSTTYPSEWEEMNRPDPTRNISQLHSLGNTLFSFDFSTLYKSDDLGENWQDLVTGLPTGFSIGNILTSGTKLYLSGTNASGHQLLVSEDQGETWTVKNSETGYIALLSGTTDKLLIAAGSEVFESKDEGDSWTAYQNNGLPANSNFFNIVPIGDRAVVWAGDFNEAKMYYTDDMGANWIEAQEAEAVGQVEQFLYVDGVLLAASRNGIYNSFNDGETWNHYYEGYGQRNATGLLASGKYLLAATRTDASWFRPQSQLTSVKEIANEEIPSNFELKQNYPNPFNPVTKISFSLQEAGSVLLNVYSVSGEKVATLINQSLSAGTYEAEFDATQLSSGVYFYKLEAGNFVSVKKMMLLK
ncbi:MAG: hypothetical protein SCALA702_05350 [Melioribacteraceae bacterium]|nr:MAG: hypothetical protein SCALA702_05350 [Melioribacteraceae bacterium]